MARHPGFANTPESAVPALATYRNGVESYVRPEVGHIRLAMLSPADVERMGRLTERNGIVYRNVAAIAAGPRRDDRAKTDDTLSPGEAEAVIAAASGDRLEALAASLLTPGLLDGKDLP